MRNFFGCSIRFGRLPLLVYEHGFPLPAPLAGLATFERSFSFADGPPNVIRPARCVRNEKDCPYTSQPALTNRKV
jgi:hypothetical protein